MRFIYFIAFCGLFPAVTSLKPQIGAQVPISDLRAVKKSCSVEMHGTNYIGTKIFEKKLNVTCSPPKLAIANTAHLMVAYSTDPKRPGNWKFRSYLHPLSSNESIWLNLRCANGKARLLDMPVSSTIHNMMCIPEMATVSYMKEHYVSDKVKPIEWTSKMARGI